MSPERTSAPMRVGAVSLRSVRGASPTPPKSRRNNGKAKPNACKACIFGKASKLDGYMRNAKTILEGLSAAGFSVSGGKNAPYIWLKTPDQMTSWEFFDYLLDRLCITHVISDLLIQLCFSLRRVNSLACSLYNVRHISG